MYYARALVRHNWSVSLLSHTNSIFFMTIEETLRIALDAHAGQKDLVGNPAILHLMAVCIAGETDLQKKAGLLHDIVEDTSITLDDLRLKGIEEEVLSAVDLLTHREEDSYEDYIRKIASSGNETAIRVKLNDLHHNLLRAEDAIRRLDTFSKKTRDLFDLIVDLAVMHERAQAFIQDAIAV